jgi:anionic cell wall polymer biosynthesis LytR-Cps2A-Psr (LCP) family protein
VEVLKMPSDDDRLYFRDKDQNKDEEDLFKKYSNEDKDSDDDFDRDREDYHGIDDDQTDEEKKLEDEFFSDSDFELKEYVEEEDEDGFRSSRIRERRRKRKLIITTVVIMSILVLVAIGIVFGYRFIKNKYFSEPSETAISAEEAIVIPSSMKLGRDMSIAILCSGDDLLEPDISTIIFSKYTNADSELISLCIPVNTLFEIPGFGLDTVNRSVEYGGPDLLKLTLENNTGIDVESYLLMDIINTVNKLESISVNLDEAVTITSEGGSTTELNQGENILNGETAHSFLKYFSGTNPDAGASGIKNQKLIVDAVMKKIVGSEESDLSKNLTKISDYIDTDLNLEELSELISTIASLEDGKNQVHALDGRTEPIDESGTLVFVPDISRVAAIFNQEVEMTEETVEELGETVTVTVLNGVGTKGIAGQTAELLRGLRFTDGTPRYNVTDVGDADNYDYTETQISSRLLEENYLKAADHIRNVLLVGNVSSDENSEQETDIIVVIGKDFDYDAAVAALEQSGGQVQETAQETTGEEAAAEVVYDINILNGEGTTGLASTAQGIIEENLNKEQKIINIKETKNADNFNYSETEILIHTDKDGITDTANNIKDALGVGTVSESSDNPDNVDITVILGSDFTK